MKKTAVLVGVIALVALAWLVWTWGYVEDDGFIHLEFAKNVLAGHGFAFDGLSVYADSSPLWVFGLVALGGVGVPLTVAAKVLGVVALGLLLAGVWRALSDWGAPRLAAWGALLVVLNPFVLHWAFAGMEAVGGAALAVWLCSYCARGRLVPTLVLAGLAPLLRYELAFLSLMAVATLAVQRRDWRVVLYGALAALPIIAWSVYTATALGSLLPTTGPAKHIFQESLAANAIKVVSTMLLGFAVPVLVAPLGLRKLRVPWSAWAWPALVLAYYMAGGIAMQTRYALAPGCLVIVLALLTAARWSSRALTVVMCTTMVVFLFVDGWMVLPTMHNRIAGVALTTAFDAELRARIPADRPIAVFGIGQHALELDNPIIDTGGLTRPGVLQHRATPAETRAWALAEGAACFIDGDEPPPGYTVVARGDLPRIGWFFDRSQYDQLGQRQAYCR